MSLRMLLLAICWSILACSLQATATAFQNANKAGDSSDKSKEQLNEYVAMSAFREKLAGHSFALLDDDVQKAVIAFLQKDTSQPPKTMPAPEQLQADLSLDFEKSWDGMIVEVTTSLDPKGELKLAARLRTTLQQNPERRSEAEERHKKFVANDVPRILSRVRDQIVAEQTSKLDAFLRGTVGPDMPGQQVLSDVHAGADKKKAVEALAKQVLQQLPDETRQTLLVESFNKMSAALDGVVSDGVTQLKDQLEGFKEEPHALSLHGISRELTARLGGIVADQKDVRRDDRLRPTYGVFSVVQQQMPKATQQWFDRRVSNDVSKMPAQLQQIRANDALTIQTLIRKNPPAHHRLSASREAVRSTIQEMIDRDLQNVLDTLVDSFRQSKSADDIDYAVDNFRQDVVKVVGSEDTLAYKAWTAQSTARQRQLIQQILPDVRAQLCDEQAAQFAPSLVDKSWNPTEEHLSSLPLSEDKLEGFPVWRDGKPPQPRESVLEETWVFWQEAAEKALAVTQAALNGQLEIVDQRKADIHARIRADQNPDYEIWVKQYSDEVISQWTTDGSAGAKQYPGLFHTTMAKIEANIEELLRVERELAEKEPKSPATPESPVPPKPEPTEAPQPQPTPSANPVQPQNDNMKDSAATGGPAGGGGGGSADKKESELEKKGEESGKEPPAEGDKKEGAKEDKGEGDGMGDGKEGKKEGGDKKGDKKGEGEEVKLVEAVPVAIPVIQRSLADLFYRIGFWILLCMVLMMSFCWYWNVRYLRRLLAHYEPSRPMHVTS